MIPEIEEFKKSKVKRFISYKINILLGITLPFTTYFWSGKKKAVRTSFIMFIFTALLWIHLESSGITMT